MNAFTFVDSQIYFFHDRFKVYWRELLQNY